MARSGSRREGPKLCKPDSSYGRRQSAELHGIGDTVSIQRAGFLQNSCAANRHYRILPPAPRDGLCPCPSAMCTGDGVGATFAMAKRAPDGNSPFYAKFIPNNHDGSVGKMAKKVIGPAIVRKGAMATVMANAEE